MLSDLNVQQMYAYYGLRVQTYLCFYVDIASSSYHVIFWGMINQVYPPFAVIRYLYTNPII